MGLYFPNSVWLQWGLILSEEAFLSLCGIVIYSTKLVFFLFCLFGRLKKKEMQNGPHLDLGLRLSKY